MEDEQGGDLLAREMIFPHSQFWLNYYIPKKLNYIYPDSYDEKLLFIAIPIGAKAQQENMPPVNIWSRTRSSWDQTSNSLTCKIIFPTYPSSPRHASIERYSGYS